LFISKGADSSKYYIIPVRGKGLWGPIWGYVSLTSDLSTIYGTVFDDQEETPGLGGEIKKQWFQSEFDGKKIFDNSKFVSVQVVKGGTSKDNPYGVNAISGATITSKGVEAMLEDCIKPYLSYFQKIKKD